MTLDLAGGMDPALDEVTAEAPEAPEHREGASMWVWDDAGRFGLPRLAVEAVGATWDASRTVTLNLAAPDGRVLVAWAEPAPLDAADARGRPRIMGGGPLRMECVEPFVRWRVTFDGRAAETTAHDQIAGRSSRGAEIATGAATGVPLHVEIEARMAAPAWVQGTLEPEGPYVAGEHRFEQLFTAEGEVRIDGEAMTFTGAGLRIHRRGGNRSDYADWYGHCWQSALLPSGRAFGYIHHRPRPDGSVKYHEGWVFDGGVVMPAKVFDAPWLTRLEPSGEDVSCTLRTPRGDVHIAAETYLSTFSPARAMGGGVSFPPLQQAIARYRWDGEEAYGMVERSAHLEPAS